MIQNRENSSRLFQSLSKVILQFLGGRSYEPLASEPLAKALHLLPDQLPVFTDALNDLVKQGFIEHEHDRYGLKTSAGAPGVLGILRVHPRGFGFLQADDAKKYPQDIFIPKHLTKNAVDGDHVEVAVNEESTSEKGPEGKVVAILKRGRTHLAGTILAIEGDTCIAFAPLLGITQRIVVKPTKERELEFGDRIIMKVLDWGEKGGETQCEMFYYLGHITDPSCDVTAAIEEFNIRSKFNAQAVEEAESWGTQVPLDEIKKREDIRDVECFTIDPDTAKDYDDAISLNLDERGHYHLGVHIADVAHYVRPGSALDTEAKVRCNSTYFPGICVPMLPHQLSDNLCSLQPGKNRLTQSAFMEFDGQGTLVNYRISRTVIKSAKRFTYREAKEIMDGKKKSKHGPTILLMVKLCHLLKKKRYERGSIEFCLPEAAIKVDEKGVPTGVDFIEYDISHQVVEEFMLKANEVVATHLTKQGLPLTYRVHEQPSEDSMREFALLAGAFGYPLSEKPTPQELQTLFDEVKEMSYAKQISTSFIRSMRLAVYSSVNLGHYGLSLEYYCHFTSPIRRYVDLITQRVLTGTTYTTDQLHTVSTTCSEQERTSSRAEQSVVILKKLRLLDSMKKTEPRREYEAVVTKVKNFGIFFEIIETMIEGQLHVSQLDQDYFVYDAKKLRLVGSHHGHSFGPGDKLIVMLRDVNFITLESRWHFVCSLNEEGEAPLKEFAVPRPASLSKNRMPGNRTPKSGKSARSNFARGKPGPRGVKPENTGTKKSQKRSPDKKSAGKGSNRGSGPGQGKEPGKGKHR